jgi:hypothetical protein
MATHKGPANGRKRPPSRSAETKSAARCRTSVYDCGRSGPNTTANEPGHFNDVRVARREALPHLRKEVRILNRRRQRPSARHPLISGGARKRRRTRRRKETGRRSRAKSTHRGCLKSESGQRRNVAATHSAHPRESGGPGLTLIRHTRLYAGHPRLAEMQCTKTGMPATSAGMTIETQRWIPAISVRKHAVLRTAMRGNERRLRDACYFAFARVSDVWITPRSCGPTTVPTQYRHPYGSRRA